ncbi:MAG: Rrf2 family transcriptional regulator [Lachnospiraceae bacterium]|nr:Rrf2 family transcriptional regulator [Lachnospiraceae bacterium]
MRISAKSRYGIAALVSMAREAKSDEAITIISLSEKLKISKIYLEQVFSLLKRGGIVISIKGSQGGYRLAKQAKDITVFEILSAIETSLFEKTEETVSDNNENIEKAMREIVFDVLDKSLNDVLKHISLDDIANRADKYQENDNFMYYL